MLLYSCIETNVAIEGAGESPGAESWKPESTHILPVEVQTATVDCESYCTGVLSVTGGGI